MKTKKIIPAIIATNQQEVEERVEAVKDYADMLQLDIMDGKFVPSHSLDFNFTLPKTECSYEAHLMVSEPKKWIDKLMDKADIFLIHFESTDNVSELISYVKSKDKKAGIVINPETKVEEIKEYMDMIDQVLVMTVNPGFYGSKFILEALDKVKEIRELKPEIDIEVDGGINDKTIAKAAEAGANLFDSGSFIVKSENPGLAIKTLYNLI